MTNCRDRFQFVKGCSEGSAHNVALWSYNSVFADHECIMCGNSLQVGVAALAPVYAGVQTHILEIAEGTSKRVQNITKD